MESVKVYTKQVWGKTLIYPANELAKRFLHLINPSRKTFTESELIQIVELGHEVDQVANPEESLNLKRA